jgi:glycosyltransferase involved in cell wall biosynthesis
MHIALVGPIATAQLRHWLPASAQDKGALPVGYLGAPLMVTLIDALLARGHRVTAITTSADLPLRVDATRWWRGDRFSLACCPMRPRAWPFNGALPGRIVDLYAFERQGLQRAIQASGADLVHAHWAGEFALAALRSGLPHLITSHDVPWAVARLQQGWRRSAYRWLRAGMAWQVLRRARAVSTVSPTMVAQMQPHCRVPVALVPNPLPSWIFDQALEPQPGRQRVLLVGHGFGPLKNAQAALRAFAQLRQTHAAAELVLLGDDFQPGGPAELWWRHQGPGQGQGDAAANGLRFVGPVPHAESIAWMARSEVLLHPSLQESFGMVLAEAQALGLPVVAGAASGAVPWVVSAHGQLVDVTQPAAMSEALRAMLDNPDQRLHLGQTGRADMAQRFAAAHVAQLYEAQYLAALQAQPLRPAPR